MNGKRLRGGTYPGRTADLGEDVELFLIHDAGETEIGNHNVGVLCLGFEEEVLGFEV